MEVQLYLASLKLSRVAVWGWPGGRVAGWLENLILMKTRSSAQTWTWTLDFNLGFVKIKIYDITLLAPTVCPKPKISLKLLELTVESKITSFLLLLTQFGEF